MGCMVLARCMEGRGGEGRGGEPAGDLEEWKGRNENGRVIKAWAKESAKGQVQWSEGLGGASLFLRWNRWQSKQEREGCEREVATAVLSLSNPCALQAGLFAKSHCRLLLFCTGVCGHVPLCCALTCECVPACLFASVREWIWVG